MSKKWWSLFFQSQGIRTFALTKNITTFPDLLCLWVWTLEWIWTLFWRKNSTFQTCRAKKWNIFVRKMLNSERKKKIQNRIPDFKLIGINGLTTHEKYLNFFSYFSLSGKLALQFFLLFQLVMFFNPEGIEQMCSPVNEPSVWH